MVVAGVAALVAGARVRVLRRAVAARDRRVARGGRRCARVGRGARRRRGAARRDGGGARVGGRARRPVAVPRQPQRRRRRVRPPLRVGGRARQLPGPRHAVLRPGAAGDLLPAAELVRGAARGTRRHVRAAGARRGVPRRTAGGGGARGAGAVEAAADVARADAVGRAGVPAAGRGRHALVRQLLARASVAGSRLRRGARARAVRAPARTRGAAEPARPAPPGRRERGERRAHHDRDLRRARDRRRLPGSAVRATPRRAAAALAATVAHPLAAGAITLALSGRNPQVYTAAEVGPRTLAQDVLGHGPLAFVAVVAALAGPLLIRSAAGARMAAGTAMLVGLLFVPGVTLALFHLTGLGEVLWRLTWALPVAALVGVLAAELRGRLLPAAAIAGVLIAFGTPVWSAAAGTSVAASRSRSSPPRTSSRH